MSYESLDTIADLFNPLWFLAILILTTKACISTYYHAQQRRIQTSLKKLAALYLPLLIYLIWVYAWMFTDNALKLWHSAHADYSTHTAVAVALTWHLGIFLHSGGRVIAWALFTAYCALMMRQGYHSAADIISTGLFTVAGILLIDSLAKKREPRGVKPATAKQ